jgi:hypothetical protein
MLMIDAAEREGPISSFEHRFPDQVEVYQGVDVPGYLALGPDDRDAMQRPGARRLDVTLACGRFGREAGPYLFRVGIWTPVEFRDELVNWYDVDHFPILLECAEWHGGRLVEERTAHGCQFYALHNLASPAALESDARRRSRATEWFQRLARNEWFDKRFVRTLYRRPGVPS